MVGINEIETNDLTYIYPNPATDFIFISDIDINSIVQIFDVAGKLLIETKYSNNQINITSLENGIYFLKIQNSNENSTKIFIKH